MASNYEQRMRADRGRFNRRQIGVEDVVLTQSDSEEDIKEQIQSAEIIENADVEFEVEGKVLKAVKVCLSMSSPVFKAMFKDDFKEKSASKIPLPGKAFADVLEFVEVTHSGRCVDDNNVEMLLPMAHEYDCKSLLRKCEGILMNKRSSFDHLAMAGKYGLHKLQEKCITDLLPENPCKSHGYGKMDSDTKVAFFERKLQKKTTEFDQKSTRSSAEIKNLQGFKKMSDRMKEGIHKKELSNYVCCQRDLDRLCRKKYVSEKGGGDHVAVSKTDSCVMCAAFNYFAIKINYAI